MAGTILKKILTSVLIVCLGLPLFASEVQTEVFEKKKSRITIVIPASSHVRIRFGAEKLAASLKDAGYTAEISQKNRLPKAGRLIVIGEKDDDLLQNSISSWGLKISQPVKKEGFTIRSERNRTIISGYDNSGALYGCMELADRVKTAGSLPENLNSSDQPEMVLRGTAVGLQKPYYLPGRTVYEYPYTPETFPWFYDKQLWIEYLDMMVENRYNSLYLWNGHPFASLVRLKDYPEAVEVSDEDFKKNEEMFRFLTEEADKRGIWVIQMFYNIIVSKPFAEKRGIATQDRNRPIIPEIADYTRKSIAAFVEKYPNVGLLVTLGEAMEGVGQDDIDWFTKTIIPGVQDGLKAIGQTTEPPIVLRAHDTDAPRVMKESLPLYKNLYTMAKYNGEALTTYTPRGSWAELHRSLSRSGNVHIENVHILANLEPFRYGSPDFIQKSVQAMHSIYEANGLHLYPQASYWDWPYTADKTKERLLQVDRDWMWYKTWARYAWDSKRDRKGEVNYWADLLSEKFGVSENAGKEILTAYEESGEIAPKLLRRYGITDGNRQTLTLGMLMTQLINPYRYGLFTLLYTSEAPEGEMIIEYAEKEWKNQKHIGETPVRVAEEVIAHGKKSVEAIEKAAPFVTKNKEEFERLKNDMYCYNALAGFYAEKAKAAIAVLRYKYSNDIADLEKAVPYLEKSVAYYRQLTDLTKDTYLYANSMQTKQRKIPLRGADGAYKEWVEVLPVFEEEFQNFKNNIDSLKGSAGKQERKVIPFKNAPVTVLSKTEGTYTIAEGQHIFSDTVSLIKEYAPELKGLKGIKFSKEQQITAGTSIKFTAQQPVKLLVGYFDKKKGAFEQGTGEFAKAPQLEIDASANDYGQAESKISNAVVIENYPAVNIHEYSFKAGTHTLNLPKGACMILGFIPGDVQVPIYSTSLAGAGKDIDWLFE